jgi:hypothetical protein
VLPVVAATQRQAANTKQQHRVSASIRKHLWLVLDFWQDEGAETVRWHAQRRLAQRRVECCKPQLL